MEPITEQRVLELITMDPSLIRMFKNKYLTDNIWKVAIENEPSLFQYMKDPSEEMVLFALNEDGANIQYLDALGVKITSKMAYTAVRNYPGAIYLVPVEYRTDRLREFACREDPSLMKDVPLHAGFIRNQLKRDPSLVRFLKNPTEDQLIQAVKSDPNVIPYIQFFTPKLRELIRETYPEIIPLIPRLSQECGGESEK